MAKFLGEAKRGIPHPSDSPALVHEGQQSSNSDDILRRHREDAAALGVLSFKKLNAGQRPQGRVSHVRVEGPDTSYVREGAYIKAGRRTDYVGVAGARVFSQSTINATIDLARPERAYREGQGEGEVQSKVKSSVGYLWEVSRGVELQGVDLACTKKFWSRDKMWIVSAVESRARHIRKTRAVRITDEVQQHRPAKRKDP
ncbi:hypothetical protein FA13DRAFT_1720395 [Coprinellus micaceus]|uniref:Uncharacterized protein n=1 Tax=Coprinellus micaceus TaxID=71717 RepID=A0A4Y7S9M2_COPMI|nr:hypothetical protein FA13DRAFT_1720395 [Coprinellus micaceus]